MYQVVFTGRLLKGADRATVESELQRLFKAKPQQVEWFLRGKPIVVKSCEDATLAGRYYESLTKAGLECELRSDQPASASMAPPPEEHAAPREQLPIPEVPDAGTATGSRTHASRHRVPVASTSSPKPATSRDSVQRHAPTLGPVTQAITAQDRAPVFTTSSLPPQKLRTGLGVLFLLVGAALVGMLAYSVRQEWVARHAPAPASAAQTGQPAAGAQTAGSDRLTPTPDAAEQKPQMPEVLIVGRWQCVESGTGRVVENEFTADGRHRSLAHGRSDAFQQIDQMDVLVEGRYRLEGNTVVLHVQNIPSREAFGSSARVDDYLYWRIDSLTRDAMVWADTQLDEVRESCLRSQAMSPKPG